MKKLMVILAIVVSLALVPVAGVGANSTPVIDGTISSGEWDAYKLGTSETTWGGGMSVDVYGFADETYLYAAYVADMTQPGWSVAAGLCVSNNLYYKTPQSAAWPDPGYTLLAAGGYPADVSQTDGSGWVSLPGSFADNGIDFYSGDGCYNTVPNPNVAEVKIPLSLLTYAGNDGQIRLSGQYWQYDWATPFHVDIPLPVIEVDIDIKPCSDPNSINLGSKGMVPVAVLTTDDFDASDVDPDTVLFADAAPVRWTLEDVDGDGDMDLLFHFKTQELNLTGNSTEATLTGETFDGVQIEGTDTVNIVPEDK